MVIDVSPEHSAKQSSPKDVTADGISIDVSPEQL
jgi:hypothetical protein